MKWTGTPAEACSEAFWGQLLDPVFSTAVDAGGNGLPDGGGVIHFGSGTQLDLSGIPSNGSGSSGDLLPDSGDIFSNRHKEPSFFHMRKKATKRYAPSPFFYAVVAAAFKGLIGARVEMACL